MKIDYESPEYHEMRHADLIQDHELRLAWSYYSLNTYFTCLKPTDKVLEFGSGLGNNLLAVKEIANETVGIEPSILGRTIATEDGLKVHKDIQSVENNSFNIILCRHVLEHVDNPKQVLLDLQNKLVVGGKLILVLPLDPLDQKPKENDINNHLFCWNPRTIMNLLRLCDYTKCRYRYEAHGARKKLMWIYKTFGPSVYARAIAFVGRVFRFNELVVECEKLSLSNE